MLTETKTESLQKKRKMIELKRILRKIGRKIVMKI